MKFKHFSKEEDSIIVNAIKNWPYNIKKVMIGLSIITGRSYASILNRWYKHLSNPNDKSYVGVCFITHGEDSLYENRKIKTLKSLTQPKLNN